MREDVPLPPRLFSVVKWKQKAKLADKEYSKFVKMLKEVNFSISAYDLFTRTLKCAKYFKTMLAAKEDSSEDELVELSAKCSSIIKKNIVLPKKLKDPESCTIPYSFGE